MPSLINSRESLVNSHRALVASLLVVAAVAGCARKDSDSEHPAAGSATSASDGPAVAPTGKVVVVELNSDANGNYFKPADFEVHRGDVIRFTLKSGVHNVHFLADSNAGKSNLPPASDMLQLPDQTLDIPVSLAPGKYYFQCDPHAALGMKGHIEVEK